MTISQIAVSFLADQVISLSGTLTRIHKITNIQGLQSNPWLGQENESDSSLLFTVPVKETESVSCYVNPLTSLRFGHKWRYLFQEHSRF